MGRRHQSLIPLSRDHHDGLALSQQIKTDHGTMDGWPADPVGQARFVSRFYDEHLKTHFAAEEESLFPFVTEHVPQAAALVKELVHEHRKMVQYASQFAVIDSPSASAQLSQFGMLLEQHIRKEERELFPLVEKHAPKEILEKAGQMILNHYPPHKR